MRPINIEPIVKRTFDIFAATAGLLVCTPLIVIMTILIRRDSEGPGIFAQERVGRGGQVFCCYKLRTMTFGTPNVPTHHSTAAQVTKIGRFLRHTKLDELPQLWNVLKGEMSLVGPRPCLPTQTELVRERSRRNVLSLRPGITGLAQSRGIDMSDPVRLAETDEEYLRQQSFFLDMKLLFQTAFAGSGRGDRVRE